MEKITPETSSLWFCFEAVSENDKQNYFKKTLKLTISNPINMKKM